MALIGPHCQGYSDAAKRWAKVAPIVKSINDIAPLRDSPDDAIKILRMFTGDNNRNVAEVLAAIDGGLKGYRHPLLYAEPINEPLPWENAQTVAFFRAIVPELHARGIKVAGPSWSVGNPELDVFRSWVDAGFWGIDLVTLHAYWATKGFTPWAAARPLRLIRDSGFAGEWAISEAGRDNLSTPAFGEGGNGGWIRDGVAPEVYARELLDFAALNGAHPGFRGFTPFTAAPTDPRWFPFNTDPVSGILLGDTSAPVPPTPPSGDIARIEARYNIAHKDGATIYLAELVERPDPPELRAECPADTVCRISTNDGQNQTIWASIVNMGFNHDAAYYPTQGQRGFFHAECEDARVDGLGWAFGFTDDTAPHRNIAVRFARHTTPPPTPQPPPGGPRGWQLAFNSYAQAHPHVGDAIGPIFYFPPDFVSAGQESATHLLIFDGNQADPVSGVHEIQRWKP